MKVIIGRPMTEGEAGEALGMSRRRLRAFLDAHGVRPAFCIGRARIRCYSPTQIEAIHALMGQDRP